VTEVLQRRPLTWLVATVAEIREETISARTLVLDVPGWQGHQAGQHLDIRLTAEDGYSAQRSYSLASDPSTVEVTVQRVSRGEVSAYLCDIAQVGDQFELRGPVGGYFTWAPSQVATSQTSTSRADPVLLLAGGSGIVPLMAMIRTRSSARSRVPFRLVYSIRDPDSVIYGNELLRRVRDDHGLDVSYVYTRETPEAWPRPAGRLDAVRLAEDGWPVEFMPSCYVCGPTGFVEAAANLLVAAGHPAPNIKTERFGPTS
jgi:ferredoxin-NADP reductase